MSVLRDRPYPGMNFLVDLGDGHADTLESGLCQVIFPEARVHTIEYRSGNERNQATRKIQTITRYGNLFLKRGAIGSLNWYEWWNEIRNGNHTAMRDITIQLLSEDRSGVVMTWKFQRARPVNHHFSALDALGRDVLIETLEIAFERLEME